VSLNVSQSLLEFRKVSTAPILETYVPPILRNMGDIRELTLGGSVGPGDSGNGGVQEF
jgi:hypothetical protein